MSEMHGHITAQMAEYLMAVQGQTHAAQERYDEAFRSMRVMLGFPADGGTLRIDFSKGDIFLQMPDPVPPKVHPPEPPLDMS